MNLELEKYTKLKPDMKDYEHNLERLKSYDMIGWMEIDENVDDIIETAKNIDLLVVIGIGGSYMGAKALVNMFSNPFTPSKVVFAGYTLDSHYLNQLKEYIKDKNVVLNVISKSGTTLEIKKTYEILKEELKKKYSKEELKDHIIITTDKVNGELRKEVEKEGYKSFIIPDNIGGRYSCLTPVGLLPMAVAGIDIKRLLSGAKKGLKHEKLAYSYASIRKQMYYNAKVVENFSAYQERFTYFLEWLKQLFGETEGKQLTGIFPTSTINTRDLHSLGQFLQEGNPIIFETILKLDSDEEIKVGDETLSNINNKVCDAVCRAHKNGNTPSIIIDIDKMTINNIGKLSSFFMLSAVFSAYLFEVDPFNQNGVVSYKEEIKKLIS